MNSLLKSVLMLVVFVVVSFLAAGLGGLAVSGRAATPVSAFTTQGREMQRVLQISTHRISSLAREPVTVQVVAEEGPAATFGAWIDIPVTEPVPAFGLMLQHCIDCLHDGKEPITTGVDGYRSVEIVQAAYTSPREGRRVTLDTSKPI